MYSFFFSIDFNFISIFTGIVNYVVFCVMALEGLITFWKLIKKTKHISRNICCSIDVYVFSIGL